MCRNVTIEGESNEHAEVVKEFARAAVAEEEVLEEARAEPGWPGRAPFGERGDAFLDELQPLFRHVCGKGEGGSQAGWKPREVVS